MVAVIGLGYVGLPLAVEFARAGFGTVGYDIDDSRVQDLLFGLDRNRGYPREELLGSPAKFTASLADLKQSTAFLIAAPTPVDKAGVPDLSALVDACERVGSQLQGGALVVIESTVYPGATREVCIPVLETSSGLKCGVDFDLGYSPERVNPGDSAHVLVEIEKLVAGYDEAALRRVENLYASLITAGVHAVPSLETAEMAKLLENCQRDVNIAVMNEVSRICALLGISTREVIKASSTKWNFARYEPGLVGGHCISVDPHYLIHWATSLGFQPKVLVAAREMNAAMPASIADTVDDGLGQRGVEPANALIAVLGVTYKPDVPDLRNSGALLLVDELRSRGYRPVIVDPVADGNEVHSVTGLWTQNLESVRGVDALVLAVGHEEFATVVPPVVADLVRPGGLLVDLASIVGSVHVPKQVEYRGL